MLRIVHLVLLLLVFRAGARSSNVTIDDADPLILYAPVDRWAQGALCKTCGAAPAIVPSLAHNGTWHDATAAAPRDPLSITLPFAGTAVYVYALLANGIPGSPGVTTTTNLSFVLDGAHAGDFVHNPDGSGATQYNVNVYAKARLHNGNHTLVIHPMAAGLADAQHSLILFDYAVYTTGEPHVEPSPATIASAIIGTALGLTVLVLGGLFLWLRRRQRRQQPPALASQASPPPRIASLDPEAPPQYEFNITSGFAHDGASVSAFDVASASHAATWSHLAHAASWEGAPPHAASASHATAWSHTTPLTWGAAMSDKASVSHATARSHYGPADNSTSASAFSTPWSSPPGKALLLPPPSRGLQLDTGLLPSRPRNADDPSPMTAVMRSGPTTGDFKAPPGRRALPLPPSTRQLGAYNDKPG